MADRSDECGRCGQSLSSGLDTYCEACLLTIVREEEARPEAHISAPAEEEAAVRRLSAFLESAPSGDALYCPGCLAAVQSSPGICRECQKQARSFEDVQQLARSSLAEISGSWYVRVIDDQRPEFFAFMLELIQADPVRDQFHARVRRQGLDFSPISPDWTGSRSVLYLPVSEIPALEALLVRVPIDAEYAPDVVELGTRLAALVAAPWQRDGTEEIR